MNPEPAERNRLLSQLQRQLRERLAPLLQALFDELDTRLFDLAERSRVAAQQHAFFDGLRECRRKRTDIEQDFLATVGLALRPPQADMPAALHQRTLSLIAHDELEETLALSALADRTASRLQTPLEALDRRIGALLNLPRDPAALPRLAPQALGSAFRAACQRLEVGIEVRLVAYTLFGNHVLDALGSIYSELNRELIAAGVLPALGAGPARPLPAREAPARPAPPVQATPASGGRAGGESGERSKVANGHAPQRALREEVDAWQGLLDEIRQLLGRQQPASPVAPVPDAAGMARAASPAAASRNAGGPAPPLPARTVLEALDRLHHFSAEPTQLKSELVAASRRLCADPHAALRAHDEGTVDLIGRVFEYVRHDRNLPEPLQPVLARLQVPFLKAALSDPELLNAADHPARRLVDELGELALGWTPSTDPEGQVLARVAQIVESLMLPHESGREPFERAIADLRAQLEVGRHRAELSEQRAVETALGRERLRIARSRVAATLERRLARHTPLPWIRQLLRGPWANFLVLLWLRQGESSEAYREALGFVDELLWCDEHGAASADHARLEQNEQALEEDLRHGLSTVAYHDREIERLASELRQFVASLRRGSSPPGFVYEIDPKLGTSDFSQSWAEHELENQPEADQVDPELLSRLRGLPPGTWFELGGRAPPERAKLSWTSPFSGRCLFVNRNGLRVDEVAPEKLAADIELGMTRILEGTQLLQRALQSLLEQLRAGVPRSA
jgi:hypothetical protein